MGAEVLILDSSETSRVLMRTFKKNTIPTVVAQTNQQAIQLLDERISEVACIVIDLKLAYTSAFEFLYEMRSYQDMKNIPIVVYSSEIIPRRVIDSQDWKLLAIDKLFYKSKHSVADVYSHVSTKLASTVS